MKVDTRAAAWLVTWLLALAVLQLYVGATLRLGSDLRLFLPEPATLEQRILLGGIGEGPAVRLLLVALEGADSTTLAVASRALVARLQRNPAFRRIANGASVPTPPFVTDHRYLLSPAMDQRPLDADELRRALTDRLQDLASPAAPFLEPLIASDPTLETLAIAEHWSRRGAPRVLDGVWFDAAGKRALLMVETAAAGFDPVPQLEALEGLESAFDLVRGDQGIRMTVSGPGKFSALMKQRTEREAKTLGAGATGILMLLLLLAYRKPRALLLAALPLASAALVGLACVSFLYGEVHGITLAFGFTLIGVAQDYPVHLLSRQRRGLDPVANARALWPTLATGVASTCVAYLAFIASGVTGLAQLGWFTISGLAVAGLTTRYVLPRVSGGVFEDTANLPWVARAERNLTIPSLQPLAYAAVGIAGVIALILAPGPAWDDDLGTLTPVPPQLIAQDVELRRELAAPDARYLAAVSAETTERVLHRLEEVTPDLDALVEGEAIAGYEHAARYLPSVRTQLRRQRELPAPPELESAVAAAIQGLPFRKDAFAPFVADVAHARSLEPLTPEAARNSPVAPVLDALLRTTGGNTMALVTFAGVAEPGRVLNWAAVAGDDVTLVDLKTESVALVIRQRERILACLGAAVVLLVLVVRMGLGDWRRSARVIAPMTLSTIVVVAVLRLAGQPLDLFHLISLVLAAGLGLDYALFFERSAAERAERLRTLHGVIVCALSTLAVFVLLSLSSIPVLRSIGVTVALGVVLNFVLAASLPGYRRASHP